MKRHRAYEGPSNEFLDRLSEPIEVAVLDYIDQHHDALVQRFLEPRLKRTNAPTEAFLEGLRREADIYMSDVLPSLMLDQVDIKRLGLDGFIAERLNVGELERIADRVLPIGRPATSSVTPVQVMYALRRIAAKIEKSRDLNSVTQDLKCVLVAISE
jgi:hypothetical protein